MRLSLMRRGLITACLGAAVILFAVLWLPSLSLGLVSDDFDLLSLPNGPSLLVPIKTWYRYSPLGLALLNSLEATFGLNPFPYHLTAVAFHALNASLVFLLGSRFTGRREVGAIAALLFTVYRFNYEAVFWTSASAFYGPMTALFLGTCLMALSQGSPKFERRKFTWYVPFLFALAILFQEQGLALLPTIALLSIAKETRHASKEEGLRRKIVKLTLWLVPTTAVAIVFLLIKVFGTSGLTIVPLPVSSRLGSFMLAHFWTLVPRVLPAADEGRSLLLSAARFLEGDLGLALAALAGGALIFGSLALLSSPRLTRYGQLLLILQFTMLPFVLFSTVEARYLYLPSAFASLMAGLFFSDVLLFVFSARGKETSPTYLPPWARAAAGAFVALALTGVVLPQYQYVKSRLEEWNQASTTAQVIITEAVDLIQNSKVPPKEVLLVNLPDGVPGAPWPAYIFRNGAASALSFALMASGDNANRFEVMQTPCCDDPSAPQTSSRTLGRIRVVRTPDARWAHSVYPVFAWEDLPSVPVEWPSAILVWDPKAQHMFAYESPR